MNILVLIWIVLVTNVARAIKDSFGSKTPYKYIQQQINVELEQAVQRENDQHNCSYDSIFMVIRHGSRWPTAKYLEKFDKLRRLHLAHLNWNHSFDAQNEGLLTPEGEEEMRSLGTRIRRMFPVLFEEHPHYHPRKYGFRSSQVLRALQSANAFAQGMFGDAKPFAISSDSKEHDYLLRFHDNCPSYSKSKKALTPNLNHLLEHIAGRVRSRANAQDEFDQKAVEWLWVACLFEATAFNKFDSSCAFFDTEDAQVMDYQNDVKDYWEKSHGQELNSQMACLLMTEVLTSLEEKRKKFYFGHAETILPVVAFLGLFKDSNHIGRDFQTEIDRKWRSGLVSPFGANIAFVSKTCTPRASAESKRYVEIRHNEQVTDVSHLCAHDEDVPKMNYACSYEAFKNTIEEKIGICDFNGFCTT